MADSRGVQQKRAFKARLEVGKHLMLLGNLAAGALVFGQAFSGFEFDFQIALLGLVTLALLYALAVSVMKGGERP
jgi:hypothetical protein